VIAENKEKTVQQCDLDGKTALDLALEEDIFTGENMTKEVIFTLFIVMFQEVYGKYLIVRITLSLTFYHNFPFTPNLLSPWLSLSSPLLSLPIRPSHFLTHSPPFIPSLAVGDAVEEDEGEVSVAALQDPRYTTPHTSSSPHLP
jgi:hypothetical protein